jgi:hypothetical protein
MSGEDRRTGDRAADDDRPGRGMGSMAMNMIGLWLGPAVEPDDFDDMPKRIGATVLMLWTLIGIALGAAFSAVKFASGAGSTSPISFAAAVPMFLPLVLGIVRLPNRRVAALAAASVLGAAVGVGLALTLPVLVGTYWAIFTALAAGALVASAVYGNIARA